jgi:hypothetical protein
MERHKLEALIVRFQYEYPELKLMSDFKMWLAVRKAQGEI